MIRNITKVGQMKTAGEVIDYLKTFPSNTPILSPSPAGRILGVNMYTEKTKKVTEGNQFCVFDIYETNEDGDFSINIENVT